MYYLLYLTLIHFKNIVENIVGNGAFACPMFLIVFCYSQASKGLNWKCWLFFINLHAYIFHKGTDFISSFYFKSEFTITISNRKLHKGQTLIWICQHDPVEILLMNSWILMNSSWTIHQNSLTGHQKSSLKVHRQFINELFIDNPSMQIH